MALNNIMAPRQQVQNSAGVPIAGGMVFLQEPGTGTFIAAFKDSGLTIPHTSNQAIRLSGSGRTNIWISRDCDLRVFDRNGRLVLEELNANPDALGQEEIGGLVPNGSFEDDADADLVPDGYTLVSEAGAVNGLDTSQSTDGAQSFRFTSSGLGGGSLTTTNFFPVNDTDDLRVEVDLRSTVAGVRNIVRVEWYDITQVPISNSDPYDSTANPLVFTQQQLVVSPPALARFAKVRLIGIDPSVLLAGSTYFDRLNVFYPTIVSGIFDNITIQNNEIISTNLNGDIELTPNGTGRVLNAAGSFASNPRVRTDIVTATPPVAEAVTGGFDIYDLDETDILAQFGFVGTNVMRLINRMHGGLTQLSGEDAAGIARTSLIGNPDGETQLVYGPDGTIRLATLAAGNVALRSVTNTDAESRLLQFEYQDGTRRGYLGQVSGVEFDLVSEIHGAVLRLRGEDSGGVLRTLLSGDADGAVQLFANGIIRAVSDPAGVFGIRSDGNTDTEARNITLRHQDGTVRGILGFESDDILRVRNLIHGGLVRLESEDAGGTLRSGLVVDPDVNTQIFHPVTGQIAAQSQDAGASDQATGLAVRHADTTYYDVGLMELPAQVENNAYTFIKADIGKNIRHTDGNPFNYTIDQVSTINVGSAWLVTLRGTGVITLVTGAGVTLDYLDAGGAWATTVGNVVMGPGEFLLKKISDILYEAIGSGFP